MKILKIKYVCKCGYETIIHTDTIKNPRMIECPGCDTKIKEVPDGETT